MEVGDSVNLAFCLHKSSKRHSELTNEFLGQSVSKQDVANAHVQKCSRILLEVCSNLHTLTMIWGITLILGSGVMINHKCFLRFTTWHTDFMHMNQHH